METQIRGFSLIEMMVVVAIIAIIGTISMPLYQGYLSDSYRNQAAVDIKICALSLEKFYSEDFTYVGGFASRCDADSPTNGTPKYTLTITTEEVASYTLLASPVSGGDCSDANIDCVQLDHDGTQTIL